MQAKIKVFWETRTAREKKLLMFTSGVFALTLLYWLIWAPIVHLKQHLAQDLSYNQQLRSWMQANQGLLQKQRSQQGQQSTKDILLILEEDFKNHFAAAPEIALLSPSKVSVNFSEVPFDDLVKELGSLSRQTGIKVDTLEVTREDMPGFVKARVILTR